MCSALVLKSSVLLMETMRGCEQELSTRLRTQMQQPVLHTNLHLAAAMLQHAHSTHAGGDTAAGKPAAGAQHRRPGSTAVCNSGCMQPQGPLLHQIHPGNDALHVIPFPLPGAPASLCARVPRLFPPPLFHSCFIHCFLRNHCSW